MRRMGWLQLKRWLSFLPAAFVVYILLHYLVYQPSDIQETHATFLGTTSRMVKMSTDVLAPRSVALASHDEEKTFIIGKSQGGIANSGSISLLPVTGSKEDLNHEQQQIVIDSKKSENFVASGKSNNIVSLSREDWVSNQYNAQGSPLDQEKLFIEAQNGQYHFLDQNPSGDIRSGDGMVELQNIASSSKENSEHMLFANSGSMSDFLKKYLESKSFQVSLPYKFPSGTLDASVVRNTLVNSPFAPNFGKQPLTDDLPSINPVLDKKMASNVLLNTRTLEGISQPNFISDQNLINQPLGSNYNDYSVPGRASGMDASLSSDVVAKVSELVNVQEDKEEGVIQGGRLSLQAEQDPIIVPRELLSKEDKDSKKKSEEGGSSSSSFSFIAVDKKTEEKEGSEKGSIGSSVESGASASGKVPEEGPTGVIDKEDKTVGESQETRDSASGESKNAQQEQKTQSKSEVPQDQVQQRAEQQSESQAVQPKDSSNVTEEKTKPKAESPPSPSDANPQAKSENNKTEQKKSEDHSKDVPLPPSSSESKTSPRTEVVKSSSSSTQPRLSKIKRPPTAAHSINYLRGKVTVGQLYEKGFTTPHEELCPNNGRDLKVLILITTAPDHEKHRNAVRQTWGHFAMRRDIAMAFMVGRTGKTDIQTIIDKENERYGDIIEGNFIDHYSNLTLKTVSIFEWAKTYCSEARFVLKTDDDMFINVPLILAFINAKKNERRAIFGRLAKGWKPVRNRKSKYYIDVATFSRVRYPDFLTGPAYLFTNDVEEEIFQKALGTSFFVLEDVLLTGIVAESLGMRRVGDSHFRNEKIKLTDTCKLMQSISIHMVKYEEQFDIYKRTLDGKTKCKNR